MKFVDTFKGVEWSTYPDQIIWFDRTSVGLWNYIRLTFRGEETVECGLSDTSLFSFWEPVESSDTLYKIHPTYSITSRGEWYEGSYWHNIYVIAKSEDEGEFIDYLYIGDEKVYIGFPVEGEDESLRINLINKGFECSPSIQSAIYHTEAEEYNPDYVLLNSKFRELLLNYMSILGNKGSYKSLINSLKWFEYGDLVSIEQVWKNGNKFISRPINQELSEELRMLALPKTTSIVLSHKTWQPRTTYNKWNRVEMNLKMMLLKQFFEAYFLPIHLEILRSAVEDLFQFEETLYIGTTTERSKFTECIKPLEVWVKESEWVSYKYVNKVIRPSFGIYGTDVKAVVHFKVSRPFTVRVDGEQREVKGLIYDFETISTRSQTVEFFADGYYKRFIVQPRDDLQLDIGLYEVVRDTGRVRKPDIIKDPKNIDDAMWLNHRGLDLMIYTSPKIAYKPHEAPFAIRVYNKTGMSFNWVHSIDDKEYETLLTPWVESVNSRLKDTGWIPQYVEAYNKLVPSNGDIRLHTGMLAQVEFKGQPVNLPKGLGAKFYKDETEFVLTYFFNDKLVRVSKPYWYVG